MTNVYVLSAVRTAIGRFGGALKNVPPSELAAACLGSAIVKAGVLAEQIEAVHVGHVHKTEPKDVYIARIAGRHAGVPDSSDALIVNRLCGSGLEAILLGAQRIQAEELEVVAAGGAENMSRASFSAPAARWGARMGSSQLVDDMIEGLHDPFHGVHMGETGENVAAAYNVTRAAQDKLALTSQRRAARAIETGRFKGQVVAIDRKDRRNLDPFEFDEHVRFDASREELAALRPAFKEGGTVTAGNASGLNDGAAMAVLAGEKYMNARGLTPMARLVSYARTGVAPDIMGIGPVDATKKALEKAGLAIEDLDVIEANEAFAAQACAVASELDFPAKKLNPNGGAIALGHPVGATGAILVAKCLHELKHVKGRYGLVTMCIGGGQGIAAIFENIMDG